MHEKVLDSLREHGMEIVNFKVKKKMQISYEIVKTWYICKEKFKNKHAKDKNIVNLGTIVIMHGSIEVMHIAYVIKV